MFIYPKDSMGRCFSMPTWILPPTEYQKVISEINNIYFTQYEGLVICVHSSFGIDGRAYSFWFENHGFNDYNIFNKVPDTH